MMEEEEEEGRWRAGRAFVAIGEGTLALFIYLGVPVHPAQHLALIPQWNPRRFLSEIGVDDPSRCRVSEKATTSPPLQSGETCKFGSKGHHSYGRTASRGFLEKNNQGHSEKKLGFGREGGHREIQGFRSWSKQLRSSRCG